MSGKVIAGSLLVVIIVAAASPVVGLLAFGALLLAIFMRPQRPAPSGTDEKGDEEPGRVGDLERRLLTLEAEVSRLRSIVAGAASVGVPARPQPATPAPAPAAPAPLRRRPRPSLLPRAR